MKSTAVVFFTVLLGGSLLAFMIISNSISWVTGSEYEVRSMHVTCRLLTDYVREHNAWPRRWDDFTKDEPARKLMADFSVDAEGMRRFVFVNFQYNMCDQADANEFTAVRAVKGFYGYSTEVDFRQLLAAAKEVCGGLEK